MSLISELDLSPEVAKFSQITLKIALIRPRESLEFGDSGILGADPSRVE